MADALGHMALVPFNAGAVGKSEHSRTPLRHLRDVQARPGQDAPPHPPETGLFPVDQEQIPLSSGSSTCLRRDKPSPGALRRARVGARARALRRNARMY
jgi:hypothetical protein